LDKKLIDFKKIIVPINILGGGGVVVVTTVVEDSVSVENVVPV
jgi:hypothetical protein